MAPSMQQRWVSLGPLGIAKKMKGKGHEDAQDVPRGGDVPATQRECADDSGSCLGASFQHIAPSRGRARGLRVDAPSQLVEQTRP